MVLPSKGSATRPFFFGHEIWLKQSRANGPRIIIRAARSRDPAHPLARPDEVISRRSGLLRCLSPVGTNLPIRHVRYTAAFRGNPDIEPTRPRAVFDAEVDVTSAANCGPIYSWLDRSVLGPSQTA